MFCNMASPNFVGMYDDSGRTSHLTQEDMAGKRLPNYTMSPNGDALESHSKSSEFESCPGRRLYLLSLLSRSGQMS
jgi:hypothetical protein